MVISQIIKNLGKSHHDKYDLNVTSNSRSEWVEVQIGSVDMSINREEVTSIISSLKFALDNMKADE